MVWAFAIIWWAAYLIVFTSGRPTVPASPSGARTIGAYIRLVDELVNLIGCFGSIALAFAAVADSQSLSVIGGALIAVAIFADFGADVVRRRARSQQPVG